MKPAKFVKSSYSSTGNCVEAAYIRSSFCADRACLEAAPDGGTVLVRDSKNPDGTVLEFTAGDWRAFLEAIRRGDYAGL